ncbi:MAG TPA: phosphoenolpyruvate mutase [Candidatus Udaeobacter sp.]|nr:phosphoenolpyruvate mutase [Candidatus Udaeobacter sp.]
MTSSTTREISKTQQFKELLQSRRLEFLMEAHNALSARIVEEAGFRGIWASGLSISAGLGVRDNNEASWTQVMEVVEFMSDATHIPILLDGDTGYGNFNNMRRLVKKLEQRGIAAVCIEDKLFPKTNSFIGGERQPLATIDEFTGKIKAVKDAQRDPDFCLVARLEGFIAGWGIDEMLLRAEAYHLAGADALLIHSKKVTPDQVLAFAKAWANKCPLVIAPTTYYSTPVEVFEQAGIAIVIWANQNVRSAIAAMQETTRRIFTERSVQNVEDGIVPVKEVFRLQNAEELLLAEERYLPKRQASTRAIILAASRGNELGEITAGIPKAMVPVAGTPLLHKLVAQFRAAGIRAITVVRGYAADKVHAPDVEFVENEDFEGTGELLSLHKARDWIDGDAIISFGDILFRQHILNNLLAEERDIVIAVDAMWKRRRERQANGYVDYITATRSYSLRYDEEDPFLEKMGPDLSAEKIHGEWIGLIKTTANGSAGLCDALDVLSKRRNFCRLRFDDLFNYLVSKGQRVQVLYITGQWLDLDHVEDLAQAHAF